MHKTIVTGRMVFLSAFLVVLSLAAGAVAQGSDSSDVIELAYDDGIPTTTLTFTVNAGTHNALTTRFTPPPYQFSQVMYAKYFVADTTGGLGFKFSVLSDAGGEPGSTIFGPIQARADSAGWNVLDLSSYDFIVSDDFYFYLEYDDTSKFSLGAEQTEPFSGRTWDTDC